MAQVTEGLIPIKSELMINGDTIREFWKQWQHEPDPSGELEKFRTRAMQIAGDLWRQYIESYSGLVDKFTLISGLKGYSPFYQSGLYTMLSEASTEFDIVNAMQCLLWTLQNAAGTPGFYHRVRDAVDDFCRRMATVLELSPSIMIRLVRQDDKVFLYPTGVRILDEALVESNFAWLGAYPKVAKPYEAALRAYMTKDPGQYRTMLDSLRFTVEQMLQTILGNTKTLENQKEEFLRWLKAHDAHNQIGGMYHTLLFGYFAKYQNDAVKHKEDQYTPAEVEFVLYLTGTFLRFMQRLIEQEGGTKATSPIE